MACTVQAPTTDNGLAIHIDGVVVEVNKRLCDMLGFSAVDLIGKNIVDLVVPSDRKKAFSRMRNGATTPYEVCVQTKNGASLPVEVWAMPTTFHGKSARIVNVRNQSQVALALATSEQRFHTLLEHAPEAVVLLDTAKGCFVGVNQVALRLFGYDRKTFLSLTFDRFSPEQQSDGSQSLESANKMISRCLAGEIVEFDWDHLAANGEVIPCEVRLVRLPDLECPILRGSILDKREALATRELMEKLSMAVDQTADMVMITDVNGKIEYVNPAFQAVTGYTQIECIGKTPRILKSGHQDTGFYQELWATLIRGETYQDILVNRRRDGSHFWEEKTITPIRNASGVMTHFVSTGKDITHQVKTRQKLYFLMHHDALTGLPNREFFLERLEQAIFYASRHQRFIGVLIFDLDRFKLVNDSLGYATGDLLLKMLAEKLTARCRPESLVAHLGGDEFAIMMDDMASPHGLNHCTEALLSLVRQSMLVEEAQLYIAASIGAATYPQDGQDAMSLLKNAGLAMAAAKKRGGNRCHFFTSSMNEGVTERLALENDLRRALVERQFVLHYQPQWSLNSQTICGMEALIRWASPEKGLIPPNKFIPVLEETGLIIPVTEWVIQQVWQDLQTPFIPPGMRVSVNVSGRQLTEDAHLDKLERVFEACPFKYNQLEIELTETVLLDQPDKTAAMLALWKKRGIRIAIDDFGTGYSSLMYLKKFPVDTLKIDRSFITEVTLNEEDATIVRTIISMAHNLNLEIVAEGVENQDQMNFLSRNDCHNVQGFFISKPLPLAELEGSFYAGKAYSIW